MCLIGFLRSNPFQRDGDSMKSSHYCSTLCTCTSRYEIRVRRSIYLDLGNTILSCGLLRARQLLSRKACSSPRAFGLLLSPRSNRFFIVSDPVSVSRRCHVKPARCATSFKHECWLPRRVDHPYAFLVDALACPCDTERPNRQTSLPLYVCSSDRYYSSTSAEFGRR